MLETTCKSDADEVSNSMLCSELLPLIAGSGAGDLLQRFFSDSRTLDVLGRLSYTPARKELFLQAVTHSSFSHQFSRYSFANYERLEFLGDSFIGFYFATKCTLLFPHLSEGQLSRLRSSVINRESLASLADFLDLSQIVLVGRGELSRVHHCSSILSDVFEAIFGAIVLDLGTEKAAQVMDKVLQDYEKKTDEKFICLERLEFFDSKSKLQEVSVKLHGQAPEYTFKRVGMGYLVSISICGRKLAETQMSSKRKAEKFLAEKVLKEELYRG